MLSLDKLTVRYGRNTAVRDLDLQLADGEIVTLVGPTGCGKTTVLRAVAGLEPPSAGCIGIGGLHVDAQHPVPPEKRRTGLVFQDFALFPHLDVLGNVAFRLTDRELAEHWLRLLGLEDYRHAMPETLSGGQKQRVALARSLAHQPALMLLDEPLSNLDAALKASLRWEIRDALKAADVPALWVTHDQGEALSVGDRVGVMRDGELVQLAPPETCFREPATRFVAAFLGEAEFLPAQHSAGALTTPLGPAAASSNHLPGDVDVLVRPDDLNLEPNAAGNAEITSARYEGETRLYALCLHAGPTVKARVNHEVVLAPGTTVQTHIAANHPLTAFARPPA